MAYFSASGTTKKLAENLALLSQADLFKIEPCVHYTSADLNWIDKNSRSSREMVDRQTRPAIKKQIDITEYLHILIGFSIWLYR